MLFRSRRRHVGHRRLAHVATVAGVASGHRREDHRDDDYRTRRSSSHASQATGSLHGVPGGPPTTILTVHAHPDDEASKGAPTLAMYGSQGIRTVLVCCTGGEEGDLHNPSLAEPGQPFHGLDEAEARRLLAEVRPLELARSAEVIGFDEVVMLGYRDSGMADSEANAHPDCFHCADLDTAVGDLVEVIRRERPAVIITYGDDHSGYPHPDHIRVHDISVLAYEIGRAHV